MNVVLEIVLQILTEQEEGVPALVSVIMILLFIIMEVMLLMNVGIILRERSVIMEIGKLVLVEMMFVVC